MIKIQNQEDFFINKYEAVAKISGNSLARFMTANQRQHLSLRLDIYNSYYRSAFLIIVMGGLMLL